MKEKFDQVKYQNKYNKLNYDKFSIMVPKGKREKIIEHYKKIGYKSMNQYIITLIDQDMNGGGTKSE